MGFSVDFTDNKSISAEILNDILAEVGDGSVSASSEFVNESLFYTDKLNCIRSEIVTGGIRSGCKAALCETGVIIGEGLCFFDSGMRMKIDAEGISLAIADGVENFVYLYASPNVNIATAVVTTEKKEGNEYVPVCRVDADGKIYDERVWCRAQIPMINSRFVQKETFTLSNSLSGTVLVKQVPLVCKAYSYIVVMARGSIAIYSRDTGKYTYIITSGVYGQERQIDMDYFKIGYDSGNNYFGNVHFEEASSCINIYIRGTQSKKDVEMIVL